MRILSTASVVAAAVAAVALSACANASKVEGSSGGGCVSCHGGRNGLAGLNLAAPPYDLQAEMVSTAVGAHTKHLTSGVACKTCHPVPADVSSPGHADGQVDVVFDPAKAGSTAAFTLATHSCANVYCHKPAPLDPGYASTPAWVDAISGCGACHADPPADHVAVAIDAAADCAACHATSVSGPTTIVPGGTHANGRPDYQMSCTMCHGDASRAPAGYQLADAAPPVDTHGATSSAAVGAHAAHVYGSTYSDGVECGSCHAAVTGLGHIDGTADVALVTTTGAASGSWTLGSLTCSSNYCHGNFSGGNTGNSPVWNSPTSPDQRNCSACHPSAPTTGHHPAATGSPHSAYRCYRCHASVATDTAAATISATTGLPLHVNGVKDVKFSSTGAWDRAAKQCSDISCHGGVGSGNYGW